VKPNEDLQPLIDALLARFGASDKGLCAAVDLAVLVATADEHIDEAEMAALTVSIEGFLGTRLAPAVAQHLVNESRRQIRNDGAEGCIRTVGQVLAANHAIEEGVRFGLAIALASEGISEVERARIAAVADAAGLPTARLDALVREAGPAASAAS
jgi:tellurite resistance protein